MEEQNKSGTKRVGKIVFWIGIVGILVSFAIIFVVSSQRTEHWGPVILGGLLLIVFFPIAVIGASLFFVGIRWEKKLEDHQGETNTKRVANFSAMAVASLVLGILGIPCFFFYNWFNLFFGLFGTVFGVIALINLKRNPSLGGRKTAMAGLILGVLLLIFGLLSWFHVWPFYWWW